MFESNLLPYHDGDPDLASSNYLHRHH